MDYHEILLHLTALNKTASEEINDFDDKLRQILQKVQPMLFKDDKKFVVDNIQDENESVDIRYQYICTIICVLKNIRTSNSVKGESVFSVKQFHTIKVCVELIATMGIVVYLLPGVGIDMAKLCSKALLIHKGKLTDLQKYRRLMFSVTALMELYKEFIFRPAILTQIGPLLAALLQLSHAPLMKPETTPIKEKNTNKDKFMMTADLYNVLKKDQEHFKSLLCELLCNCPTSTSMKELMVILGIKGAPQWLQREIRRYLTERLMQPDGVVSLIVVICEDTIDLGEHWNKLDTITRLIATSHGNNPYEYYKSICPQILELLASTQVKYAVTIANCCITALYEYNPSVCLKNIVEIICDPLLIRDEEMATKTEDQVEKCIENLTKCLFTAEAKFKQLPCHLLMKVAIPLFSLHNNIRQSSCLLKSKIKQLLLRLLNEECYRSDLFAAFLGHDTTNNFGNRLVSTFGPTGKVEIKGIDTTCKYEEYADSLLDLIFTIRTLSIELFSYLLKFLSNSIKKDCEKETKNLLESEEDIMERIKIQLAAVKLLSSLANIPAVQEAQIENPKPMFSFIKSLFDQYVRKRGNSPEDDDYEILYISLMLVKMIFNERKKSLDWITFSDFVKFFKECCALSNIPSQLLLLMQELIKLIESKGKSFRRQYQDLSVDHKSLSKFEEAMKDLTDPLLPVRAHGLITLTKLIETMDPCTIARKAVLLHLFKENLKHEDSFIYLAAINGLCALAISYPQVVIETLVQEYIDMPQRILTGEITMETRIKLGEILVKVTRALGEMASAYKSILINGFLYATRDPNSLVRASSLSCLGELCKVLGFRLGDIVIEVVYCISCIVKTDKAPECRRAAVMVSTLLLRGLGKDTLTSLGRDLVDLHRGLKYLRDNDEDPVLRLHAQLALEELDHIVGDFLFAPPKLEKRIFLLDAS